MKHHLAPKARYSHHHPTNYRTPSRLISCSALRGKEKPRSSAPIGVSTVDSPRWGSSTHHTDRASHNRRPLSTASLQKGWPPWSSLYVDVSASTPRVAESSISASSVTADKYAVGKRVVISTAGLNAMRRIAITRTNPQAGVLIASVRKPTATVRPWLERGFRRKK